MKPTLTLLGSFALGLPLSALAQTTSGDVLGCQALQEGAATIAAAKLYVEYNATDDDIGVHGSFDDHGFSELCIYDPNGVQVVALKPLGPLKDLTLANLFFESREPPQADFSFEKLKQTFPEGRYEVRGVTFEGKGLTGAATFTHAVPAPPTLTFPAEEAVVSATDLTILWEPVLHTVDGGPVTITAYEVIVTKESEDDPNGFSRPTFDVHVPAERNSLSVPAEFLEPNTTYELEVLALEQSGNQTITVSFFQTE